jgi:hypothetical protein
MSDKDQKKQEAKPKVEPPKKVDTGLMQFRALNLDKKKKDK